jgi:cell division protein FtsQ
VPAAGNIDPRIRQRRIEVRREEGRRRLRIFLVLGGAVALAASGWLVTRSPLLDVDRVEVRGARHTPAAEVLRAAGVDRGDPMVDLREQAVAARVARLPWVGRAEVRQRWPGTVVVTVRERRPLTAVPAPDGAWALVDGRGRVLAWMAEPPADLLRVLGLPPPPRPGGSLDGAARGALQVARAFPDELRERVTTITVVTNGTLELGLTPRGVARFGPVTQVGEKLVSLATVLRRVDQTRLAVVDVRVPSAPTVTRG